jgi:hypothetical protein
MRSLLGQGSSPPCFVLLPLLQLSVRFCQLIAQLRMPLDNDDKECLEPLPLCPLAVELLAERVVPVGLVLDAVILLSEAFVV